MSYSYETVLVEKKESHAVITLNRPDKFNAANAQLFMDLRDAINELDADQALWPLSVVNYNIGEIYLLKGQPQEALPFLTEALEGWRQVGFDPATPLNLLGRAYFNMGQYERAYDYYEEALTSASENDTKGEQIIANIGLGNITILAETATQVASYAANGQDGPAGMKMVQRFFLNRIIVQGRDLCIDLGNQVSVCISPHSAFACFPFIQDAVMRTKETLYPSLLQFVVESCRHHGFLQVTESCGNDSGRRDQK